MGVGRSGGGGWGGRRESQSFGHSSPSPRPYPRPPFSLLLPQSSDPQTPRQTPPDGCWVGAGVGAARCSVPSQCKRRERESQYDEMMPAAVVEEEPGPVGPTCRVPEELERRMWGSR